MIQADGLEAQVVAEVRHASNLAHGAPVVHAPLRSSVCTCDKPPPSGIARSESRAIVWEFAGTRGAASRSRHDGDRAWAV